AADAIEVAKPEIGVAHEPVVGDQYARNRTQRAAVETEPGKDVDVRVRQQVPGLNHDAQDPGDQSTGAEADQLGDHVREVVGRAHDVGRHVDRQGGDGQREERKDHDQRVVELGGQGDRIPDR